MPPANDKMNGDRSSAAGPIVFNVSKKEIATPTNGFKKLYRKLRSQKVQLNKEELSPTVLDNISILVFGGPREKFKESEFKALTEFVERGGSVLYLSGEGGDNKTGTNFNYFLEEYGMSVNNDSVIRTSYQKYQHPKEVLIQDGVINKEINRIAGKKPGGANTFLTTTTTPKIAVGDDKSHAEKGNPAFLSIVYPYGSTLHVQKPAVPVICSGVISYPLNRPICSFWTKKGAGRVAAVGSAAIFDDKWLEEEENSKLQEVIFRWLQGEFNLNQIDADSWDLSDYHYAPNTEELAERVRCCLQETEELPKDPMQLFDDNLFSFDTHLVPDVLSLYEDLGVKHDPLTLIPPHFEVPLPPLQPAVFAPILSELPPPPLELFDLDEQFASEKSRLAQVTSVCKAGADEDLEYMVREAGEILGVVGQLKPEGRTGKHILEFIFKQIVNWKKLNQDAPMDV
ncbi:hypothetical protein PROFUN_02077 [Planoprotostelium fungivorum]|uniref:Uncharacterized protein n=1 Tax=Planoprotostelium fungivorum TaxID=1890364 RepID=A0A2P6NBC6_9EUKA|nr:hypothetical protein PROFUN_02077 [Planoprotostelium fungivorum]